MNTDPQYPSLVDWAMAGRPLAGETICGDVHLVQPFERGVLLAVVDGLGHGEQARTAARAAVDVLENNAAEPISWLIKACHEALLSTRGVVMTIASIRWPENTMSWLGVGNVEGRLLRAAGTAEHSGESVLQRSGLIGYQIPTLNAEVLPIHPGDLILFASDGLHSDFDEGLDQTKSPQEIADHILEWNFKGTDDAMTLVVRYLGSS